MIGASRAASGRAYQVLSTTNITSTGTQTYTIPSGVVFIEVEMYGGGGGGGVGAVVSARGGSSTHTNGQGGGGGAYVKHKIQIVDLRKDDTLTFTVGAGGGAGINTINHGVDGGDTQLTLHKRSSSTITTFSDIIAGGGEGGRSAQAPGGGLRGEGGVAENGNLVNTDGGDATNRTSNSATVLNGTAGGAGADPDGGDGGSAATSNGSFGAAASAGDVPGGGGGGGASSVSTAGADGANGKVIVKAFG